MSVANEFNKFSTIPCLLKDFITVSSSAIPVTNLSLEHVDLSVLDFGMVSQFGQLMSRSQSRGGFLLDHSTLLIQSCFQFFHLMDKIYGSISFLKISTWFNFDYFNFVFNSGLQNSNFAQNVVPNIHDTFSFTQKLIL